ncbi:MAG: peptide chain release factor 2 [Actinomycetota bacterium]
MQDFSDDIASLRKRLDEAEVYLKIEELRERKPELEDASSRPDLWDDPDEARKVTGELSAVTDDLNMYDRLSEQIDEAETLAELGAEAGDDSVEDEVRQLVTSVADDFESLELRSLLSGEYDERDVVVSLQSGEGGTDAQDWAEMLLKMYLKWAERRSFSVTVESAHEGSEAGLTSAEVTISGRYAYGWMRSENGVHRLVRISPFNKEGKRQTAFASISVVPLFDELSDEIEVDDTDLRIDTYRSSGAGGQHVNVTDSAVRITHLPTGVVTSCQNERSQHQNKDRAMQMLKAKLLDLQRQERQAEIAQIAGEAQNVGFGSQIRSYVLQPYEMVKDLRSEFESGDVGGVLNGGVQPFMEAYLQWQRAGSRDD